MVTFQESPTHPLSEKSTAAVPDSIFHATDFILGAGVVIIQPSTSKIVLVTDKRERWFLPKGRKDKGESLEQTALREAYEEVNEAQPHPSTHSSSAFSFFHTLIRPPSRVLMSMADRAPMPSPLSLTLFLIPSHPCSCCTGFTYTFCSG